MKNGHKYIYIENKNLQNIYNRNNIFTKDFYGKVLFVGMGNLFFPKKINVDSISIIEKYDSVIELNKHKTPLDWTIYKEDAYTFETTEKFDVIMLDLWYYKIPKKEMDEMIEKYQKFLEKEGKILYLKSIINNK